MARQSLKLALALTVVGFCSPALADPPVEDIDARLAAESAALPTPSLALRLKVRAAAYRAVLASAETLDAAAAPTKTARVDGAAIVVAARVEGE